MDIRFISSLTSEDEEQVAQIVIAGAAAVLDQLGIAYTLRIETASGARLQRGRGAAELPPSQPELVAS